MSCHTIEPARMAGLLTTYGRRVVVVAVISPTTTAEMRCAETRSSAVDRQYRKYCIEFLLRSSHFHFKTLVSETMKA